MSVFAIVHQRLPNLRSVPAADKRQGKGGRPDDRTLPVLPSLAPVVWAPAPDDETRARLELRGKLEELQK